MKLLLHRDVAALTKTCVLVFMVAAAPTASFADDNQDADIQRDREAIKGVWRVVSILSQGRESKGEQLGRPMMVTNGNDGSWLVQQGDKVIAKGDSTIDPGKSPKTIDFRSSNGESKGQSFLGIYELGKNKRRLCFTLEGGKRPTEFASPGGSKQIVVTFKRVKQK